MSGFDWMSQQQRTKTCDLVWGFSFAVSSEEEVSRVNVLIYMQARSHPVRESTSNAEKRNGGGMRKYDISSCVPGTVWKCHIIAPDASVKVGGNVRTEDNKRSISSLYHPQCVFINIHLPFLFFICAHMAENHSLLKNSGTVIKCVMWFLLLTLVLS